MGKQCAEFQLPNDLKTSAQERQMSLKDRSYAQVSSDVSQ
jgi:hypothetical protein